MVCYEIFITGSRGEKSGFKFIKFTLEGYFTTHQRNSCKHSISLRGKGRWAQERNRWWVLRGSVNSPPQASPQQWSFSLGSIEGNPVWFRNKGSENEEAWIPVYTLPVSDCGQGCFRGAGCSLGRTGGHLMGLAQCRWLKRQMHHLLPWPTETKWGRNCMKAVKKYKLPVINLSTAW